jgi:hypothetical protein
MKPNACLTCVFQSEMSEANGAAKNVRLKLLLCGSFIQKKPYLMLSANHPADIVMR